MDVFEALYTTRAMRRVRPDPIPDDVQRRIIDAAIRAPSGGNAQNWRFLFVDDPAVRAEIAVIYADCLGKLWTTVYAARVAAAEADPDSADSQEFVRIRSSAQHLADHFGEVPLLLFAFAQHDSSGGSIFPGVWSAMLAARALGVGSALTSVMAFRGDEVLEILGVPAEESWHMACCVTFGYPTGRWGVAQRVPAHEVTFRNRWGSPVGFEVPEPLWAPTS
jgi:nitroreductase